MRYFKAINKLIKRRCDCISHESKRLVHNLERASVKHQMESSRCGSACFELREESKQALDKARSELYSHILKLEQRQ